MKKKAKQLLREMSDQELVKHVSALEAQVLKEKLDRRTKQIKREVAVGKTILRERELL